MTNEQMREIIQRVEVIIDNMSADPKTDNVAYNRCVEKALTKLEESHMWMGKTLNTLE